eukprot:1945414-Pyramimonas_sp.AAC.1
MPTYLPTYIHTYIHTHIASIPTIHRALGSQEVGSPGGGYGCIIASQALAGASRSLVAGPSEGLDVYTTSLVGQ